MTIFLLILSIAAITALVAAINSVVTLRRRLRRKQAELSLRNMDIEQETAAKVIAEQALERERHAHRILFNHTTDMVYFFEVTEDGFPGRITDVNEVALKRLGHTREKMLAMTPLDLEFFQPEAVPGFTRTELVTMSDAEIRDRQKASAAHQLIADILDRQETVYERILVTRTGTHIPVEVHAHLFMVEDRPVIMCMAVDVTERQQVRKALRESERRFHDFFEHSPIGVALFDAQNRLVDVNPSCLRMFGIPDQTAFKLLDLFCGPFVPPTAQKTLQRGETARYEAKIDFSEMRGAGTLVTTKKGIAIFDVLVNNLGLDRDFNPRGYLAQVQDITKRRATEEALLHSERQLRQAQKMEAIGTLAGGIAHDFNNILTPIIGYTEMTLHAKHDDPMLTEAMREILKASNRAKDLVQQILTFSRQTENEFKPLHVTPVVKEVLKLLRASLPPSIEIERSLNAANDIVLGDPTRLHQVMMNLCTNAAHAMEANGGKLTVSTDTLKLDGKTATEYPRLGPGEHIRLSISDTGHGIPAALHDRIFEPFFTTKDSGKGTGMGLAVVHGIVTALQGAIKVESTAGVGSTFHVVLPTRAQEEAQASEDEGSLPAGHECVLFVDDEVEIIKMATRMLAILGYKPVVARHPRDALEMFEDAPDRFDLLMTDHIMPEISGLQLVASVRKLRPALPVILCTGFSESFTPEDVQKLGIQELMMKPILMRDLALALRRALDGKPAAVSAGAE